jgi:DNA-binding PadR family transcriptional regulator
MAKRRPVGNLLALSVLSLLATRPMYPYEMAQTMRARGKEQNFKVKWGSLYTVVRNLESRGFIAAATMDRDGRQPERTTYELTASGRDELQDWLSELLSVPEDEQGGFVTALSEAGSLAPDDVVALLTTRLAALDQGNDEQRSHLALWSTRLPRVLLIESEYQLAMREAQATWLRGLLGELTAGTISGIEAWRQMHRTGQIPAEFAELEEQALKGWKEDPADDHGAGGAPPR